MRILSATRILAILASVSVAAPAFADEPIATTQQSITLAGKSIAYTAEAGRLDLKDESGAVRAKLFFTAYRIPSQTPRPVTFIWNGGPGANSSTLQFRAFGPKGLAGDHLADNPDTLLPASDLVFLDPMSTGYSRAPTEADAKAFYGTLADITWTARFIAAWRETFHAERQPVVLLGESFGVPRAAGVSEALAKMNVPLAGAILISGGKIAVQETLPKPLGLALYTPNKAMAAFLHGKLKAPAGGTVESVEAATAAWARDTYAPILARIDSLTPDERETAAADLARHLGVPASAIDRKTLVMTARTFLTTLVPGKKLDAYDMRKANAPNAARGKTSALLVDYFKTTLGYKTADAYWGLEPGQPKVNQTWTYAGTAEDLASAQAGGGPPESTPWLSRALALNPGLKVYVAVGYYDSQNSCEGNAALHAIMAPAEAAAISTHCYTGGHMMYLDAPTHVTLAKDLAGFIRGVSR